MPISNFLVNASAHYYKTENVTVLLDWSQNERVLNNIQVMSIPQVNIWFIDSNAALLTLSYNTLYDVNIVASHCGQTATNVIQLNYGRNKINNCRTI